MEYLNRVEEHNTKLSFDDMSEGKMIEPSSLTIFGCTDLHTEDLLQYFKTFAPDKVAWVDDDR
jgi:hypothetical protein